MHGIARNATFQFLRTLSRYHHSSSKVPWQYEELKSRTLLKVSGKDGKELLQGLATKNLNCLDHNCDVIYSFILNIKGRVLYDVFIYRTSNDDESGVPSYLVECDKIVSQDLQKHLKLYKLRKKVTFSNEPSYRLFALLHGLEPDVPSEDVCLPSMNSSCNQQEKVHLVSDPRLRCWSARLILPSYLEPTGTVENCIAAVPGSYSSLRYDLGIPEGVEDFPVGKSLPLESNGAILKAISFNKGCYLGQELTARSYHTGVTRKRLMPLKLTSESVECAPESPILSSEGQKVGKLRSLVDGRGLGLLRLSALSSPHLTIKCSQTGQELAAVTHVPAWWPSEIGMKFETAE